MGTEANKYKVEIVRGFEDLAARESEFRRLWHSINGRPFNSFQWMSSWFKALPKPVKLFVVCAFDDQGALKGVAPYYSARLSMFPGVPYRTLRPIGDPASLAEYLGWLVDGEDREGIARAIAAHLASTRGWDLIWMPYLDESAGSELITESLASHGIFVKTRPVQFSGISLPSSIEEFLKEFSAKNRNILRRDHRRAFDEDGCELACASGGEDFARSLSELIVLHNKRWNATGIEGSFQRSGMRAKFLSDLSGDGSALLRIYTLKRKGEAISAQLGAVHDGVFYQLQEGFDPDDSARYSAGNVLRFAVIDELMKSGIKYYDFMGGFEEHNRRWRAVPRDGVHLLAVRPSLKNLPFLRTRLWITGRFVSLEDIT